MEKFIDRKHAGIILAKALKEFTKHPHVVVLALPRGGVPVAYEIAKAIAIPLDVFLVRKLGVPNHKELAMGAISSGGTVIFNEPILNELQLNHRDINTVLQNEQKELRRREALYRGNTPFPILQGKTVILVDDGIATGSSIRAAVQGLRKHKPTSIIIAAPVAAASTYQELLKEVNTIICPLQPENFQAVGLWYDDFTQVSDDEVVELLQKSRNSTYEK
jgi:putative phosphoribosyl transferase